MKCKNGHAMHKAANGGYAKHCGECGATATGEEMVKCASEKCGATFVKSAAPRHCLECGEKLGGPDPAVLFDAELETLNAYAKARVQIEKDLEVVPTIGDDEVDLGAIETLVKSAKFTDEETGKVGTDATPLVAELLKAVGHLQLENRAIAEHHTKWAQHVADGLGRLVASVGALGAMVKAQGALIEQLRATSRGTRQISLAPVPAPHAGGGGDDPMAKARNDQFPEVDALTLMAKAQVAFGREGSPLGPQDLAAIESWTGMGYGLRELAAEDPGLALKAVRALSLADGGAH